MGTSFLGTRSESINALLLFVARYLYETDGTVDIRMAQHYYHQALALKPFHGTPHNQLGTLFLTSNHGLDATYYYLRR